MDNDFLVYCRAVANETGSFIFLINGKYFIAILYVLLMTTYLVPVGVTNLLNVTRSVKINHVSAQKSPRFSTLLSRNSCFGYVIK